MENTFCSDASRIIWENYKESHQIGLLMLYLNIEHPNELVLQEESLNTSTQTDPGMEI